MSKDTIKITKSDGFIWKLVTDQQGITIFKKDLFSLYALHSDNTESLVNDLEELKEHIENIKKAIDSGIEQNQRNIGFNTSQGSIELFAKYLHKLHLIENSGDQFDHRIFKNKNLIEKKLPTNFPNKETILNLMKNIELERIALCYGSRKPKQRIEKALTDFWQLKKITENE